MPPPSCTMKSEEKKEEEERGKPQEKEGGESPPQCRFPSFFRKYGGRIEREGEGVGWMRSMMLNTCVGGVAD